MPKNRTQKSSVDIIAKEMWLLNSPGLNPVDYQVLEKY